MQEKKYFTVEEANDSIPELTGKIRTLLELKDVLESMRIELEPFFKAIPSNGGDKTAFLNLQVGEEFKKIVDNIEKRGCFLKGLDPPLIDFPHILNGREVYLCWKYDEKEITYWHEVESGFDGRQPL